MKFQNRSIHGSKVNRRTDRQTDKPKAICPSNIFKVGGIMKTCPCNIQRFFQPLNSKLKISMEKYTQNISSVR